jgi:hypothetical protein
LGPGSGLVLPPTSLLVYVTGGASAFGPCWPHCAPTKGCQVSADRAVLCCCAVLCCAGLQKLMRELDAARAAHEEEVAALKEEVAAAKRRETAAQAEATAKVGRRGMRGVTSVAPATTVADAGWGPRWRWPG